MEARRFRATAMLPAVAGAALVALTGCAGTGAASKPRPPVYRDCLFEKTVNDWAPLDNQHLIIFGPGRQQAFLTRLFIPNPDLMFNIGVGIIDDDNNAMICGGASDALLFGPRSAVPGKNLIDSMQKIDRATAEHLLSLTKDRDALKAAIDAVQQPAPAPVPEAPAN